MLVLFYTPKNHIHTFHHYEKLYKHLERLEADKENSKWTFARHSHDRVFGFYKYVCTRLMAPLEKTGPEGLDILEIVRGDVKKPVLIPITPDLDVESLRKKWCQSYCKSHGYPLADVSSPADFSKPMLTSVRYKSVYKTTG